MKKETAKAIYSEVPDWMKKVLVDEFGEKTFAKKEYTDIKTLDDVILISMGELSTYAKKRALETKDEWAYRMLKEVVKVINQGWEPDWNNTNQPKYWPYFNLSSGFGFSRSTYAYDSTFASVGSRLCFETREKSDYAAEQFLSIYKDFLTI